MPFVRDDEHDVRTPRPDLFDRPYPQEFGGDALRKVITYFFANNQSGNFIPTTFTYTVKVCGKSAKK